MEISTPEDKTIRQSQGQHQPLNNVASYPRKTVLLQNPKNSHPTYGNTTLTLELFPIFSS